MHDLTRLSKQGSNSAKRFTVAIPSALSGIRQKYLLVFLLKGVYLHILKVELEGVLEI